MKRIFIVLTGLLMFMIIGKADDKPVSFERLPLAAREFIRTNFPQAKMLYASVDDDFIRPDYEVMLDNGIRLQFENNGSLDKIETGRGDIPPTLIPVKIREYVETNYPDATYREYEVGKRNYEVKLSNGLELKFDSSFRIVEIDD